MEEGGREWWKGNGRRREWWKGDGRRREGVVEREWKKEGVVERGWREGLEEKGRDGEEGGRGGKY